MRLAQLFFKALILIADWVIAAAMIFVVSMIVAGVTAMVLTSRLTGKKLPSPLLPELKS
jgi:hypothetical protein